MVRVPMKYGKWQGTLVRSTKYYWWYEYMESVKYALQGTVVGSKIQKFLMLRVSVKYGKWQENIASGRELHHNSMK